MSNPLIPPHPTQTTLQLSPSLPPVDDGRDAWFFLAGATTLEALVWGLPFSIGVLHVYWVSVLFPPAEYPGSEGTVVLAATLQTGLMYMSVGWFQPLFRLVPRWTKAIQIGGLIVAAASMIASAFVTQPWHLVVTIGIFFPFAAATYLPAATLLFEWFQIRRGLAAGILFGGTGAGGAIFPFLVQALLDHFGYKAAMISLGIGFGFLGGLALIPVKRRVPLPARNAQGERRVRGVDWELMKRRSMIVGMVIILMTGLGNFIPPLWLPTFADDLALTRPSGVGLVAIMNAASVPGTTLMGYLSDHLPLRLVIVINCTGAALTCILLWGLGTSDGLLVGFAMAFGLFGLSFSALWSRIISVIARDDPSAPAIVFSVFAFIRGIGNVVSGPVSDALLNVDVLQGAAGAFGFKNYGMLLVWTAGTIFGGGVAGAVFKE